VIVWTFSEEERLEELLELGVDGILTDDPRLLRRLVDRMRPGQPSVLSG
jgi:glycerophosphoryl diester phosphodiesterase